MLTHALFDDRAVPGDGNGAGQASPQRRRQRRWIGEHDRAADSACREAIIATKQSKSSNRPYETVEPLAQALGLVTRADFKDDQFAELAASLRSQSHGHTLLICWHHGMMPQLLQALGADPTQLLPDGKWPSDEFSWLLALRFDAHGKLSTQHRIEEHLMPQDSH